jgi:Cu-Zn family superoxide dismutase
MMRTLTWALAAGLVAAPALAQPQRTATAAFVDLQNNQVGQAQLTESANGVLIRLSLTQLATGPHAVHIHETGSCEPSTNFESAGGHFAPEGRAHGFLAEGGPHAGDLPMQWASTEGFLRADIFTDRVTLGDGETSLLDDDGSAIVIHAGVDDYQSQPSGNAGDPVACAVIRSE